MEDCKKVVRSNSQICYSSSKISGLSLKLYISEINKKTYKKYISIVF